MPLCELFSRPERIRPMLRLDFLSNDYQDTRSSVEKTTDAIAIEILTGILRQGRHLAEQQLCERYQLSRTPIREVLKNLESLGLIELIPNRGAIVRGLPASALDDLFYMKALLYPQCVRWAIERITPDEFSMLEDQRYILSEILHLVDQEQPDGVLIAGDVYDKSVPSGEAVTLLHDFLVALSKRNLQVFLISGNHDSPERLSFGGRLMAGSGIHVAPVYQGRVDPIPLEDQYGPVNIYLLPFLKPAQVRRWFPDREIVSYTDALTAAVEAMGLSVIDWQSRLTAKHIFTHVEWRMTGYTLTVRGDGPAELEWVDAAGLAARSVPSAFARYYEEAKRELEMK